MYIQTVAMNSYLAESVVEDNLRFIDWNRERHIFLGVMIMMSYVHLLNCLQENFQVELIKKLLNAYIKDCKDKFLLE